MELVWHFLATIDGEFNEQGEGHFVTLIEFGLQLIECNPGHIWMPT